jgi:hypothetical protein
MLRRRDFITLIGGAAAGGRDAVTRTRCPASNAAPLIHSRVLARGARFLPRLSKVGVEKLLNLRGEAVQG